jgi:hypothetical protein
MCRICNWDTKPPEEKKKIISKVLYCSGCPLITSIPSELVTLTWLDCNDCPLLTEIPSELVNLEILRCSNCPLISSIPSELVNLKWLECYNCPLITSIPSELVNLTYLECRNCPLITKIPQYINSLYYDNCPWLDHPENKDFKSNMEKLTLIQRNMKTLIKYKRFKRAVYSREFARLWYHPSAGGGRRAKRRILEGLY